MGRVAGPPRPAAAPGLSKEHISPLFRAEAFVGASLLRLRHLGRFRFKPLKDEEKKKEPFGLRKKITEFSKPSRRRLRLKMAILRRACLPWMVTLTYPREWDQDDRQWKRDLDVFLKRLKRQFPTVALIWKLEFQERGAPHFHLFLWGLPLDQLWSERIRNNPANLHNPRFFDSFRAWLSCTWFEVVGSGDEKHFRAGTRF